MLARKFRVAVTILSSMVIMAGCVAVSPGSQLATNRLKMVSAGHTGCLPDAIDISNVTSNLDGSGLWNASCKGKQYLCSGVASGTGQSESFSCAPAVN